MLRDQKDAEDATQEAFIKIYYSLPQYENQGLKTWMTRIAVNHAIDLKRKRDRRREDVMEASNLPVSKSKNLERVVLSKEQRRLVHERLDELPINYREAIYDFYIAEKSYQEMAKEQQVGVKTIETRLYRARNWMKKRWREDDFL